MPTNEELQQERIRLMIDEFERAFGLVKKKGTTAPDKLPGNSLSMQNFGDRRIRPWSSQQAYKSIISSVQTKVKDEVEAQIYKKYEEIIKQELKTKLDKVFNKKG
jgi:hypothetical protein